jgi:cellulose biosynthesis protein BcsQ
MWVVVQEAIRAATLVVIPARPGFFDLAAVRDTVAVAREQNKPYAVVINAAPVKRDEKEAPAVTQSRAELDRQLIPVWSGQISQRAGFVASLAVGASAGEMYADSAAGMEIARLWSAIARSIDAINAAQASDAPTHGQAA